MKPFTYKEYLYYSIKLNMKSQYYLRFKDDGKKYKYTKLIVHHPHDKIFKEVLEDKGEVVEFLNRILKIKQTKNELREEDIEKYNRRFVLQQFSTIESDIIYKKKNQDIFFLIENQSKIDYSMPYRILKYNMAIMESAIDKRKINNKDYKLPAIYSFVIYTGNKKWNVEQYIEEKQQKLEGVSDKLFSRFEVIDINNYSEKELLKDNKLLSKIMLLEKAKDVKEIEQKLAKIFKENLNQKQILFLKRVIEYILKDKINTNKYIKIINDKLKGGNNNMNFVKIINDYIDDKMIDVIAKNEQLEELNRELEEKNKKVEEKNKKVEEKNKKVEEKNKKVEEKNKKVEEKKGKYKKRNKK